MCAHTLSLIHFIPGKFKRMKIMKKKLFHLHPLVRLGKNTDTVRLSLLKKNGWPGWRRSRKTLWCVAVGIRAATAGLRTNTYARQKTSFPASPSGLNAADPFPLRECFIFNFVTPWWSRFRSGIKEGPKWRWRVRTELVPRAGAVCGCALSFVLIRLTLWAKV